LLVVDCVDNLEQMTPSIFKTFNNCEIAFFKYDSQEENDVQAFLGNRYRRYGDENHFQTNTVTKNVT
jgi:hypothetical protein